MAKSKTKLNKPGSPDNTAANSVANGFFQDPYAQSNVVTEKETKLTIEDLAAVMRSVHELISKADELLGKEDYDGALPHLLESYELLTEFQYSPLSDEVIPIEEYMYWLAWVCFRIAFCYVEAEDYVSAYFYIDLVRGVNADCFMEWINVLVNSSRMDALGTVETYADDPELLDPIVDNEEEKKKVMDFLQRRLGFLYIEYGEFEKARELLTRLIDNPDCAEFARDELAYLDSL